MYLPKMQKKFLLNATIYVQRSKGINKKNTLDSLLNYSFKSPQPSRYSRFTN